MGPELVQCCGAWVLADPAGAHVRVGGVLDTASARPVAAQLARVTEHGTREASVDLSEVTFLAGAGVRMLRVALVEADRNGVPLRLVARPGTSAYIGLRLVGLLRPATSDPG